MEFFGFYKEQLNTNNDIYKYNNAHKIVGYNHKTNVILTKFNFQNSSFGSCCL